MKSVSLVFHLTLVNCQLVNKCLFRLCISFTLCWMIVCSALYHPGCTELFLKDYLDYFFPQEKFSSYYYLLVSSCSSAHQFFWVAFRCILQHVIQLVMDVLCTWFDFWNSSNLMWHFSIVERRILIRFFNYYLSDVIAFKEEFWGVIVNLIQNCFSVFFSCHFFPQLFLGHDSDYLRIDTDDLSRPAQFYIVNASLIVSCFNVSHQKKWNTCFGTTHLLVETRFQGM